MNEIHNAVNYDPEKCDQVHDYNVSERCNFVVKTVDCRDESYVPYMLFIYCGLGNNEIIAAVSICAFWLLFLFLALGVTADDFLCPSLVVITKTLRLSQNIAGVTFLAFGNGAPDIFSSLAGIEQARSQLVIGELFGAGIFVTTTVVGCICLTKEFKIMERPFLRDIIFYSCASFWAFYLFYTKEIALRHAIGFIALYMIYIIVAIVSRIVFQKCHEKLSAQPTPRLSIKDVDKETDSQPQETLNVTIEKEQTNSISVPTSFTEQVTNLDKYDDPENEGVVLRRFSYRNSLAIPRKRTMSLRRDSVMSIRSTSDHSRSRSFGKSDQSVSEFVPPTLDSQISKTSLSSLISKSSSDEVGECKLFCYQISPIDILAWSEKPWYSKILEVCKSPIYFILTISTPLVDDEDPSNNWNKPLAIMHCIVGPVFVAFASKRGLVLIGGVFPVVGIVAIVSIILAFVVIFTSKKEEPPKYYAIFSYLGFAVSVTWIYCIAKEIVSLLKALGIVFGLSDAILGLTVLAWGNSIGDFISNTSVAKQGYPRMGISACYGGPLLNLLLGVGIPYTISIVRGGHPIELKYTSLVSLLYGTLCFSLVLTMLTMTALKFQVKRWYGFILITIYVIFLVAAILLESKIVT
ncbi:mitochondrial sodium/calcium exchanger protein-like isoform X2 [Centruroides sculpturatus]|uniref:mitochondrial sodium/calcium exchanger protein-like isoform X2 n=1 Tax=Centruroides sculpturatus TaxID=218467 RepID=UPI000C6D5C9C|nr:mitochondrial sodium/calcium exchanger protein-like isoform X2 [Centruroides sculpturatus]